MAVSLTHTTVAVGTDAGNGEIAKAQWNENHTLTAAVNNLLGTTALSTTVVEIPCTAAGRALLDDADAAAQRTTLSAAGTGVSNTFTAPQTIGGLTGAVPLGLQIDATTDPTSERASLGLGSWGIGQDTNANGTKDFFFYYWNGTSGIVPVHISTSGDVTFSNTVNIPTVNLTNALTVADGGTGATTLTGLVKGNGTSAMTAAVAGTDYLAPAAIGTTVQAYDADLSSIAGLAGTSGFLKKTAANTWTLDTTLQTTVDGKAPLNGTGTSGTWPISISGNAATATNATQLGGLGSGSYARVDASAIDQWLSFRVIRNATTGSDGMFIGYGNASSGNTRIYSGGSTVGHYYSDASGNVFRSDGALYLHTANYTSYAVAQSNWTNWNTQGVLGSVVGLMAWKNYGNSHVIFDASNSTAPNGAAVNNTNPTYGWSAAFPTLMGWNGVSTYGVRVDSSRVSDYASSAGAVDTTWLANWLAGRNVGSLGSYAFLRTFTLSNYTAGQLVAGSDLRYTNANGSVPAGGVAGTWMLMGNTGTANNSASSSVWLRVS